MQESLFILPRWIKTVKAKVKAFKMKFHRRLLRPDWFLSFNLTCDLLVWKVFLYFQTLLQLATDSRCYQLRRGKSSTSTCPKITTPVFKLGGWMGLLTSEANQGQFLFSTFDLGGHFERRENLPAGLAIGSDSVYWVYSKKKVLSKSNAWMILRCRIEEKESQKTFAMQAVHFNKV